MSLKSWVIHRVHGAHALVGRADLDPREPDLSIEPDGGGEAGFVDTAREAESLRHAAALREPTLSEVEHLGAYGPLIGAVRAELERFVHQHVRLHVSIADRDRFVLTSIGVQSDGPEARGLLLRFMREFKPEQIKRYVAREIIAGLPNASAIDLAQFAGLVDHDARAEAAAGEYDELIAALNPPAPAAVAPPYEVHVVGRWTELEAARAAGAASATVEARLAPTPSTPLAGRSQEIAIEDAGGARRMTLAAVVPGRRYLIGKGETCDIRIDGTYASRRHVELWFDRGTWWVADAGSTNGMRVESAEGVRALTGAATTAGVEPPIRLADGARIVLSARAEGAPADYPVVSVPVSGMARQPAAARITPIASAPAPKTPLTAIRPARASTALLRLVVEQAGGARTVPLEPDALPFGVGRSRSQALVVDRAHDDVSGRHLEIVRLDAEGAAVRVLGDNGVERGGVVHGPGSEIAWRPGETLALGRGEAGRARCTLRLDGPSAQA